MDDYSDLPEIPRIRKERRWKHDKIQEILSTLVDNDVSLISVLLAILDSGTAAYETYRGRFYRDGDGSVARLLDVIYSHNRGKRDVDEWMRERAVDIVCETVYDEMEKAKESLHAVSLEVSSDSLKLWNLAAMTRSAETPAFSAVLKAATENERSVERNVVRNPNLSQQIITLQCHHIRSRKSAQLQQILGIYFWSEGCPRRVIEFLGRCSLSTSFTSALSVIERLSDSSVAQAKRLVVHGPHAIGYDNVNVCMSEHVEQRPGAPPKVKSGTFGLIYELRGRPRYHHMLLAPMKRNLETANDLTLADVTPSLEQSRCLLQQFKTIVVRALTTHHAKFASYADYPSLQHLPRRPLSHTEKNIFHPLPITTIGEGDITGNLNYHDHVYLDKLQQSADDASSNLCTHAIPLYADLHTMRCVRSGQRRRTGDVNSYTDRQVFQLGFGLFHMLMNLIWAIRKTHFGSESQLGSLSRFFNVVMGKVRLANDRPDFHTLLAALEQIRDGILLEAWRRECGSSSLDSFHESQPCEDDLLAIAERIIIKYATPVDTSDVDYHPDPAHENIRLLLRDLLFVAEITRATADGDFGRIEDTLPDVARLFRGAGYNNYSTELIHFIHNVKKVWTPEFADIMRDNMLVNVSGLPHHFMGCDMNIEHLIGYIKYLFTAKGVHSSWDRLANASGAVADLMGLKKTINDQFNLSYKSRTHSMPDTSALVRRVAADVQLNGLLDHSPSRETLCKIKPAKDLHAAGHASFASSTLSTFNKNMNAFRHKTGSTGEEEEQDELEAPDYASILPGHDEEEAGH
ncbi:hypothetical protein GGF50DRAFT_64807 [Schizophyllum commune]